MPPVTPSKLANAGVLILWRSEWRLSIARLWFTAGLYFLRAELVGGWPNAVVNIMGATEMDEKYTRGFIASGNRQMSPAFYSGKNFAIIKTRVAFFADCRGGFPGMKVATGKRSASVMDAER
jgi:hypothetical protein